MTVVPQLSVQLALKGKTMSNGLVAVLFCVGLLAVGRAVENPSGSGQPDDKGKNPEFRAGAVRYQVKDVDKAVEFYTKHLGFKLDPREPAGPPFAAGPDRSLPPRPRRP